MKLFGTISHPRGFCPRTLRLRYGSSFESVRLPYGTSSGVVRHPYSLSSGTVEQSSGSSSGTVSPFVVPVRERFVTLVVPVLEI